MKGLLYKTTAGWVIKWSVPQEYKIPVHEMELHPVDVQAREPSVLGSYGEVEFEVVSVDYGSGISKGYARITADKNPPQINQPQVQLLSPEERVSALEELAEKLSQAWFYGNWKAETANEREMEKIMRKLGYWPRPNKLKNKT